MLTVYAFTVTLYLPGGVPFQLVLPPVEAGVPEPPQPGTAPRQMRSAITSHIERFPERRKKAKPRRAISKPPRPTGKFIFAEVFAAVVTLTLAVALAAELKSTVNWFRGSEELIAQIQELMWNEAGIVRTRAGMTKAVKTLEEIAPRIAHPKTRRAHEAANLYLAATLVARSALAREESRGSHYRIDCPDHDDRKFLKHSIVRGDAVRFV